jgi:replicative DNA helicase
MNMKTAKAHNTERGFQSLEEAMALALDKAASAQGHGSQSGISTGVAALDDRMRGLQRSDLTILAGGLSVGKTSLVTSIAYNIASAFQEALLEDTLKTSTGGIVGFYSLAMSADELATRIISEQTKVPLSKIRRGDITDADFEKLVACSQKMQKVPLYIDQTGSISVAQLSARARRLKRQRGLDVLIIDYLQLLLPQQVRGRDDEAVELARILRGLKSLAKEINVAIFAVFETHDAETAEYKGDMRFIHAELDKGTVDFATLIRRQANADAIEISFWDTGPAESTEAEFDGGSEYAKNERPIVDFSEYMSHKMKDWDQTIQRIDENLKRFQLASGS